jgi:putative methionine-R-sulfoxide reductase with GAF domain
MPARPNFVADERFLAMRSALDERLGQVRGSIRPEQFAGLCTPVMFRVFGDALQRVGASEGSVWLLDENRQNLVIAYNTGPRATEIVGRVRQPLTEGIVSMVVSSEQSFVENEVYKNRQHSKLVDEQFDQVTQSMIVVPFYLLKHCRGVVSCVHLSKPGAPTDAKFTNANLGVIQHAASVLSDLIDYRLLRVTVGWKPE